MFCFAQISEPEARHLVESNECVKNISFKSNSNLLRISRNEDFENQVFRLQKRVLGDIHKGVYIYEVYNTGFFVLSPNEVVSIDSTRERKLLIAVSSVTSKVYPLYGCPNAEQNFSELIKNVNVLINSTFEAESFVLLHYTLVDDPERQRWIINFRQFKHEVENHFFDYFPPKEANIRYTAWINKNRRYENAFQFGTFAKKQSNGYLASVTYFTGEAKGEITLKKENIFILVNGEYNIKNIDVLIPIK